MYTKKFRARTLSQGSKQLLSPRVAIDKTKWALGKLISNVTNCDVRELQIGDRLRMAVEHTKTRYATAIRTYVYGGKIHKNGADYPVFFAEQTREGKGSTRDCLIWFRPEVSCIFKGYQYVRNDRGEPKGLSTCDKQDVRFLNLTEPMILCKLDPGADKLVENAHLGSDVRAPINITAEYLGRWDDNFVKRFIDDLKHLVVSHTELYKMMCEHSRVDDDRIENLLGIMYAQHLKSSDSSSTCEPEPCPLIQKLKRACRHWRNIQPRDKTQSVKDTKVRPPSEQCSWMTGIATDLPLDHLHDWWPLNEDSSTINSEKPSSVDSN